MHLTTTVLLPNTFDTKGSQVEKQVLKLSTPSKSSTKYLERVQPHTAEKIMDGLAPQVLKQTLDVMQEFSQARISSRVLDTT